MPATARARVRDPHNKVRTSTALQGNAMWENVIGIVNEQAGSNAAVEAMLSAPTIGGGRKQAKARQQAAAQAVMATGGFDTAVTNYQSLLSLARTQGAVGGDASRGACKVCGQVGHLTKQCRNQFSKYAPGGEAAAADPLAAAAAAASAAAAAPASDSDLSLSSDDSDGSSSDGSSESGSSRERRRRKRKEKKRKHKRDKERRREKKRRKEKKHKKDKKRRSRSRSRSRD